MKITISLSRKHAKFIAKYAKLTGYTQKNSSVGFWPTTSSDLRGDFARSFVQETIGAMTFKDRKSAERVQGLAHQKCQQTRHLRCTHERSLRLIRKRTGDDRLNPRGAVVAWTLQCIASNRTDQPVLTDGSRRPTTPLASLWGDWGVLFGSGVIMMADGGRRAHFRSGLVGHTPFCGPVEFDRNIWHIADQMSDEQISVELINQIQAEPVFDEFTFTKLAEIAEYEDRRIRAVNALKELRAEADERDRAQADARFAEAKGRYPHLSVHQIAAMLDDPDPVQFTNAQRVNAVQVNAVEI